MKCAVLLISSLFLAQAAQADILFLDMNDSYKEVEAARRAAKARGDEVIVYPTLTPEQRKEKNAIAQKIKTAQKEFSRKCTKAYPPECNAISQRLLALQVEQNKVFEKARFDTNALKELLRAHVEKGREIKSLVISGHDGTGHFHGVLGSVSDSGLAQTLQSIEGVADSIRGVHLWGCYTTSPSSLLLNWQHHFPNSALISGYEGIAPSNEKKASSDYLEGVLKKEADLIAEMDLKKIESMFKKIPGTIWTTAAINRGDCYVDNKKSFRFSDLKEQCGEISAKIKDAQKRYYCYLKAESDECAHPPKNTRTGEVRKFYELLQEGAACLTLPEFANEAHLRISRDQAIRLVLFSDVQKNFARIYETQLKEIDEILEKLGAPGIVRFSELDKITRRELLVRVDQLLEFLVAKYEVLDAEKKEVGEHDAQILMLRQFQADLSRGIASIEPYCVPFDWVEPGATAESPCISKGFWGKAGVEAQTKLNPDQLKNRKAHLTNLLYEKINAIQRSYAPSPPGSTMSARDRAEVALLSARIQAIQNRDLPENSYGKVLADYKVRRAEKMKELAGAGEENPELHHEVKLITLDATHMVFKESVAAEKEAVEKVKKQLEETTDENARKLLEADIQNREDSIAVVDTYAELAAMNYYVLKLEKKQESEPLSDLEKQNLETAGKNFAHYLDELAKYYYNSEKSQHERSIATLEFERERLRGSGAPQQDIERYESAIAQTRSLLENLTNGMEENLKARREQILNAIYLMQMF